jgi:hypothetical protein
MIDELKDVVRHYEASRPRSRQRDLGPSEAGSPCSRRLAYRLLGAHGVNSDSDPWPAIVGTSVHSWLEKAFSSNPERYDTEVKVELPTYMRGTVDLIDKETKTVIDHKVLGLTSLKEFKAHGPSDQYRTQVHLYACGLRLAGYDIEHVAIAAWSRSGWLKDAHYWSEPYNEALVEAALRRIDALRQVTAIGRDALPLIPTADAKCTWCPFYVPAVTDVTEGCPGHAGAQQSAPAA